nr:MAG TPA: hypothetical protein [Caudoviricetes sp.]
MTDINSLNTQELVYNINHQKAEIARYVKQKCNTEQNINRRMRFYSSYT